MRDYFPSSAVGRVEDGVLAIYTFAIRARFACVAPPHAFRVPHEPH
jgi:hypothetical protein